MKKRRLAASTVALMILACLYPAQAQQSKQLRPNIIFILIDDSPQREYNPMGYIIYDATGRMALQITRRSDRAKFASEEIAQATIEEKAAAFGSYAAYYGRHTINEAPGTITHHVEGSLNPNDVGKGMVRNFKLSGNRITLIPVETSEGRPAASPPVRSLTWERVK